MKRLLLFFTVSFFLQTISWGQCPTGSNIDSDGDGVLDCIDPCINAPSSVIGNLSFESDFIGWTIPQNQSFFSINEDINHILHGSKSLMVTAPNASTFENHAIYSEEFTLEEGVPYNFKIPVKRIGDTDGDAIRWILVDENGVYRHFNNYYDFTSNWSYITFNNFLVNFDVYSSNKFRLRLEFGLSTVDMVVDKIEFYKTSQGEDSAYADYDSDGIPDCGIIDTSNHPDYNALVLFYNGLGGENWTNNTNWLSDEPINTWYGIGTLKGDGNSRVTSIYLKNNNLTGEIPEEISQFSNLFNLDLSQNNLSGSIPQSITNLGKLAGVEIQFNNLSGEVPDLSGNEVFSYFYLNYNNFQFGDFENSFTNYQNKIGSDYKYAPQYTISSTISYELLNVGDDIDLVSELISGNNNTYQWSFNGAPLDINTIPNITDPTSPNLRISNIESNQFGTYQCIAKNSLIPNLSYVVKTVEIGLPPTSSPDFATLIALYNSLNGDNWQNKTNWLDASKPLSTWYGIKETNGRITEIIITNNNVSGVIPPELTGLTELEILAIENSNLSGEIPSNIGNLTKLRVLSLYDGRGLTGNIPNSIQNCTNLEGLYLSFNQLDGNIPDFTSLNKLSIFSIDNNNFQFGDFEPSFANYQNKIGSNYFYSPQKNIGEFYDGILEIGQTKTLTADVSGSQNSYTWSRINIDGSQGGVIGNTETIDITINTASDYKWFYFYESTSPLVPGLTLRSDFFKFSDIPSNSPDYDALVALYNSTNGNTWTSNTNWLDNTKPLNTWKGVNINNNRVIGLWIENNNLTGTIPNEIDDLTELTYLNLYGNNIMGSIPTTIGNLNNLTLLNLSSNNFSDGIPSEIGNLVNLTQLSIGLNGLTGTIPSSFQNLTNLRSLFLAGHLEGFNGLSKYSEDFPDLTSLPLENLDIKNNYFKFTDIADELETYKANIQYFDYSPQFTVDAPEETEIAIGDNITLTLTDVPSTAKGMKLKRSLAGNMYQWYKDGVALTMNANSDTYVITNAQVSDSGIYHCEITNADVQGMTIKRQPITLNVGALNIEDALENLTYIYPNPTKNTLNIKLNNSNKAEASLYDISGRLVLKQKLQKELSVLNIENLNSGMYLLQIKTENNTTTKRIIKQ